MTVDPLQSCVPELTAYTQAVAARRGLEAALSILDGAVSSAAKSYMENCPWGIASEVGAEVFEDLNLEEESELRKLLEELWKGPIDEDVRSPDLWALFLDVFGGINDIPAGVVQNPASCLSDAISAASLAAEQARLSIALNAAKQIEADRLKDYHRCLYAARFQAARRDGLIPPVV